MTREQIIAALKRDSIVKSSDENWSWQRPFREGHAALHEDIADLVEALDECKWCTGEGQCPEDVSRTVDRTLEKFAKKYGINF